ncbi:MAG: hypothetical protein KDK30_17915, partial [Leptospiraceae bacterium]|nr:hypothetical protein [Leptospiraceae bacterium]
GNDLILAAPDPRKAQTVNPLLENRHVQDNSLTAYVCTGLSCRAPAHDPTEIIDAVRTIRST